MKTPKPVATNSSDATFKAAEETGLKFAIRGRFVALVILGTAIMLTRDSERIGDFALLFGGFALLGILHYCIIGTHWERSWDKVRHFDLMYARHLFRSSDRPVA